MIKPSVRAWLFSALLSRSRSSIEELTHGFASLPGVQPAAHDVLSTIIERLRTT